MSETPGYSMLMDAVQDNLHPLYGRTVNLLDQGDSFVCLISRDGITDVNSLLGSDLRESDILRVRRSNVPARLLAKDCPSNLQASIDGQKVVITKRQDSVASPDVEFEIVKVV